MFIRINSFNKDGYTSRHLFIHEKTHFFWGRHWSKALKDEWEEQGKWHDKHHKHGGGTWGTPMTTAFSSDYGASNNPDEDLAEWSLLLTFLSSPSCRHLLVVTLLS